MSQKILRLAPGRGMFMADGVHLVNPEKPVNYLPETYQPTPKILAALKAKILIDVNGNIVDGEKPTAAKDAKPNAAKPEAPKAEAPKVEDAPKTEDAPKVEEAPVVVDAVQADANEDDKPKGKRK